VKLAGRGHIVRVRTTTLNTDQSLAAEDEPFCVMRPRKVRVVAKRVTGSLRYSLGHQWAIEAL